MPVLDNQRHELFAQNVASGMAIGEAYVKAGYGQSPASATRLSKKSNIQERIQEIKVSSAERAEIDRAYVLNLIQDIIEEAREAGQYGPAITGAVKLGVDIGMFESKSTITHKQAPNEMTDDQLAAVIATGNGARRVPH